MNNKALAKARAKRLLRPRWNIYAHIWRLIWDYTPEMDLEIRRLLEVINRKQPGDQGFIERLGAFWNRKIDLRLHAIWNAIRDRKMEDVERKTFLEKVREVERLIDVAVEEMMSIESHVNIMDFLSEHDHRLYLKTLVSFLENPFEPNEARIFSNTLSDGVWEHKMLKIGIEDQFEPERVIIKPLRELAEDDLMGQMMQSEGLMEAWPAGRIVVAGWNLSIVETEEGEFLTPIEEILIEFGGCPLGLVFDSRKWMSGEGYNPIEKSCSHCWKKDYCPGTDVLRAWTLGSLAKKLQFAWEHRDDIISVIPEFRQKLLQIKK